MLVFITRYLDLGASLQYLYLAGDWTYSLLVYNTIGKVLLTERIPHAAVVCPTPVRTHRLPAHTHAPDVNVGRVPVQLWGESRGTTGVGSHMHVIALGSIRSRRGSIRPALV